MVRRGTRGIGDVMTQIKKMLLDKSTNESVMEYISVSWSSLYSTDLNVLTMI